MPDNERRLLQCATGSRCRQCPSERICAWSCVQGMNVVDIMIGAALEQEPSWAFQLAPAEPPGQETVHQALWDLFNS